MLTGSRRRVTRAARARTGRVLRRQGRCPSVAAPARTCPARSLSASCSPEPRPLPPPPPPPPPLPRSRRLRGSSPLRGSRRISALPIPPSRRRSWMMRASGSRRRPLRSRRPRRGRPWQQRGWRRRRRSPSWRKRGAAWPREAALGRLDGSGVPIQTPGRWARATGSRCPRTSVTRAQGRPRSSTRGQAGAEGGGVGVCLREAGAGLAPPAFLAGCTHTRGDPGGRSALRPPKRRSPFLGFPPLSSRLPPAALLSPLPPRRHPPPGPSPTP